MTDLPRKFCLHCGEEYFKSPSKGPKDFMLRKYCSRQCKEWAYKAVQSDKEKRVYWMRKKRLATPIPEPRSSRRWDVYRREVCFCLKEKCSE